MKKLIGINLLSLLIVFSFAFSGAGFIPTKTINELKNAVKGETTASEKYFAFSDQAKKDGYYKIAALFEATGRSEAIHAANHKAALNELGVKNEKFDTDFKVGSTVENLKDAINGETYEIDNMYPEMIKIADGEDVNIAGITFNYALKTEKKHKELFQEALTKLQNGQESKLQEEYYVCATCGNTYAKAVPARCGISMTPRERFIKVRI